MILCFVFGMVIFDDRRPMPVERLRFDSIQTEKAVAAPVRTASVPETVTPPKMYEVDDSYVPCHRGSNRRLRAVRLEERVPLFYSEDKRFWRLFMGIADNSGRQRCLRRERRRGKLIAGMKYF
jgi:hypothetical protein